jgi:negative regulator of sigma E activity
MNWRNWKTAGITIVVLALAALAASVALASGGSSQARTPNRAPQHVVQPTPGTGEATPESSVSESSTETETADAGEPAGGHEDPPGAVDHECTGNCVE